ncbi:MAG: pitrilysin family protein [Pseudomonadota bacterium]
MSALDRTIDETAAATLSALPNGFRVASERIPGLASVCVGIWVEAGARHEAAAENGVAHFLEHMAFKGTESRSAERIAQEIEDVGGRMNAYTSYERTAFHARVIAEDLPLAVDILADILRRPALDAEEMELERGVILSEIGLVADTPEDVIFDWLQETAFPDQPLGRPILGSQARVGGFSPDDLRRFIGAHYRPGRMVLAAAGAVEHAELLALAEAAFGDMQPDPAPERTPARYGGGERREDKALQQAHFALGLRAPGFRDRGHHAAQLAATALGGGMSSRLFVEARERRGLCYTIGAHAAAHEDLGLLTVYAGTSQKDLAELMRLTAGILHDAAGDLSEEELRRAQAQARAGLLMGLEGASARAERLAANVLVWGRPVPVAETLAKIEAVDLAALRAAAGGFLAEPPTLALYGPVGGAEDGAAFARRLAA